MISVLNKKTASTIIITLLVFLQSIANDSIPSNKKIRIGIYGGLSKLVPTKVYDNKAMDPHNPFPYYSYSNFINFAMNLDYKLYQSMANQSTRKCYLGLSYGLNSCDFKSGINDYSENGHFSESHQFSGIEFKENIKFHSVRLNFALNFEFQNWFLSQKIGCELSAPFQSKYSITYTETVNNSYPTTSPAYVTPSNPQGWYWVNNKYEYTQTNTYRFKSAVNPYYSLNIGPRFGQYYLYIGGEISYYGNSVQSESTRTNTTSNINLLNNGILYRAQISFAFDL